MATTQAADVQDQELVGSWFGVELDNGITGNFSEVTGLDTEIAVIEITDANTDTTTRKRPGQASYSELTLKRTLTPDKQFWNWAKSIRDGSLDYRTNGSVIVFDMAGTELVRWNLTNLWPSKWSASDLDVGSDDPMMEDVTLQCEFIERVG